ncbi:MAG: glycosyltransferase family 4 protein [Bacteroidales bacterium]|nr:glycosyltransferase family 4 protein [Bacteroidales bacterium]
MNIGFDAKRAFSNKTGLGNYSRTTIDALYRLFPENHYSLYTPSADRTINYNPPNSASIRLPDKIWSTHLKGYWRTFGLTKSLERDNIQLYHGLSNELPVGINKTEIKSIVTIHDLIFMRLPKLYHPIDRRIYYNKVKNAVRTADRIIAISKQTREDLIELFGTDESRIHVVYQGCNPWFYERTSREKKLEIRQKYQLPERYLLYVGTIEERKALLTIIRAVHKGNINIPLVVVGKKTNYYKKVGEYIENNHVDNIKFYHHIENADLPAVYQQAEIFIYPSKYEGFGIPVLEALNSGIPVITTKGGCLEETAGEGGMLIDPGNVEQLILAIGNIMNDNSLREDLVKKGKEHAKKFREEHTIPQLYAIYKDCLL